VHELDNPTAQKYQQIWLCQQNVFKNDNNTRRSEITILQDFCIRPATAMHFSISGNFYLELDCVSLQKLDSFTEGRNTHDVPVDFLSQSLRISRDMREI